MEFLKKLKKSEGGNSKSTPMAEFIWQDREIRFDLPVNMLSCRTGEKLVDKIEKVEDTKGNNGEFGLLLITNLRLIWYSETNQKINLSVGLDCILNTEIKETNSALRGNTLALYIRSKYLTSRYEFIFTSQTKNSPRLFTSFQAVIRSYETTKLYRDLKLRCAIVQEKNVIMLPQEQIFSKYNGVWNLSAEQGNLGTFYITNIRVVWFANLNENFNVSLPWVQVKCVRVRDSKYGTALVLETSDFSGGYVLGFRMEQLEQAYAEISQLFQTYMQQPFFGVECVFEDQQKNLDDVKITQEEDNLQIVETGYDEHVKAVRQRYALAETSSSLNVVFNEDIGLACEELPSGVKLDSLWKLV